jgi:hypothetical protein
MSIGRSQSEAGRISRVKNPWLFASPSVERQKRLDQRVGARWVHGVSGFDARADDGGDSAVALDRQSHVCEPLACPR